LITIETSPSIGGSAGTDHNNNYDYYYENEIATLNAIADHCYQFLN